MMSDDATNTENTPPSKLKSFSWLGFFFAPHYYAGYGQLKKGIVMALLSSTPYIGFLISLAIGFYGGFKARQELPIGQQPFNWKFTGIVIAIQVAILTITATIFTLATGGLPSCEDERSESVINDIVADNWSLEMISLGDIKEVGFNKRKEIRACTATLVTTRKQYPIQYSIKWQDSDKENFYIEVKQQ